MKYTIEEKCNKLTNNFPFFDDNEATEAIAKKLTGEEVTSILKSCREGLDEQLNRYAARLLKMKTYERKAELEERAARYNGK